ncbi:IclR family transcriptional regulator [Stutzerimonas stutzeri]|uniref:IclR family transcriptional regulator n=1 Tax=Stutzerimonas stutzeri TaxID=316 RepID=W8RTD0_STUST|nr:IclR family transcriptional regulator [Stutzerimonas stutzeri]AHL75331.1 IclR family transcriptional regulator [Stutzerimonas stutzeri]MCQ4328118.1 IclR family transcriptional regulator [Stutzerimonas stutzeri]
MTKNRVEAVDRAISLLEAFSSGKPSLSLRELAELTGMYKSTILRLSGSLEHFGYLSRDDRGEYCLGPALSRLALLSQRDNASLVRPVLQRLVDETEETASFYVREGAERVCLFRANSRQEIRHHLEEGARMALNRGASGRILLAFSDESGEPFDAIRKNGFYISKGERAPDVAAIAIPVRAVNGGLAGALSVSGLRSRFTDDFVERALAALKHQLKDIDGKLMLR